MPVCPSCELDMKYDDMMRHDSKSCLPYWARRILLANQAMETQNEKGEALMELVEEIHARYGKVFAQLGTYRAL